MRRSDRAFASNSGFDLLFCQTVKAYPNIVQRVFDQRQSCLEIRLGRLITDYVKMRGTGAVHKDRLISIILGTVGGWSREIITYFYQNSTFARRISGDHNEHEDHRVSWDGYRHHYSFSFPDGGRLGDMYGVSDSLCACGVDALSDMGMSGSAMCLGDPSHCSHLRKNCFSFRKSRNVEQVVSPDQGK
jgi:hypothetical protein